jgi:aspartate/methionine/tyrosine aminotransferase
VPGLSFPRPEGAFYVFAGYPADLGIGSAEMCAGLLDDYGLAAIPGSAFGDEFKIRLSFAASDEDIREGVLRLSAFLAKRSDR